MGEQCSSKAEIRSICLAVPALWIQHVPCSHMAPRQIYRTFSGALFSIARTLAPDAPLSKTSFKKDVLKSLLRSPSWFPSNPIIIRVLLGYIALRSLREGLEVFDGVWEGSSVLRGGLKEPGALVRGPQGGARLVLAWNL